MNAAYAVKNAKTGEMFSGFAADGSVVWSADESSARSFSTKLQAQAQANLFRATGVSVQRKPAHL